MQYAGIPGMSNQRPTAVMGGPGIPVNNSFAAQQQQMQATQVAQPNGVVDPDMLFKTFTNSQQVGANFNWETFNRNQVKTPLDGIVQHLSETNNGQEDVLYKQQLKMVAFNILTSIMREINGRGGPAYQKLINALELTKFGYLNNAALRYQCPVRTAFHQFAFEQRSLINSIAKNAAICALALTSDQCYHNPNIKVDINTVYGFFEQWVINISALEMVNWFNFTEQGKMAYAQRSKELEQALETIDQIVGASNTLFEWFGLQSPYINLSLKSSSQDATVFNRNVIPTGLEMIMTSATQVYQTGQQTTDHYVQKTNGNQDFNEQEFYRRQLAFYQNAEKEQEPQQVNYAKWEGIETHYDTSPVTVSGRTDYQNITPDNARQFDWSFLTPVEVKLEGFKGKAYVTNRPEWRLVKYCLNFALPDPKPWTGNFTGRDIVYLVVLDDNFQWYEQLINTGDVKWMASDIISNPTILLPDLIINKSGQLEYRHQKEEPKYAENNFSAIFAEDELGEVVVENEIKFEDGGARIADETPIKSSVMQAVCTEIETVANVLKNRKPDSEDIYIYSKPVVNTTKRKVVGCLKELKSFKTNINFFASDNDDITVPISSVISAVRERKDYILEVSPTLYNFMSETLTQAVNRWLVEKRGYIGLTIKNVFDDYESILNMLKRVGDKTTFDALMNGADHKWIFDAVRIIGKSLKEITDNQSIELTMVKKAVVARVINYPHPDYQKDICVIKRSEFPELFTTNEHAVELGKKTIGGFVETIIAFDDGQWWSFTQTDIDSNTAVMRRLLREGSLVDWKLGLSV